MKLICRKLLVRIVAFVVLGSAVGWAQTNLKLQQPPAVIPKDFPKLSPLLQTDDSKPITTKRQWEKEREKIKADWFEFMGEFPKKRAPLKAEFLEKQDLGSFTRQYVRYQIEEGIYTDGYLLTPKDAKGKLPAMVVFHGTTPLQAKAVAGVAPDYEEEKRIGLHLVQLGYLVWCPRNYIFDDITKLSSTRLYTANTEKVKQQNPKWTGMTRMTFDAVRAADFVESLPNADKKRIGCIGHSLGGKVAIYAAGFDERYKVAVSSDGGIGLKFSNWDAVWYLGKEINQPSFKLENHQVVALIAPRAFLLLAGESADNDKSWAFLEAAFPVYDLYGKRENLAWFNHREGHRYSPKARAVAETYIDKQLR